MSTAISISGLVKTFGPTRTLDGLDLTVNTGEVHGFLGPNGAGKTTDGSSTRAAGSHAGGLAAGTWSQPMQQRPGRSHGVLVSFGSEFTVGDDQILDGALHLV